MAEAHDDGAFKGAYHDYADDEVRHVSQYRVSRFRPGRPALPTRFCIETGNSASARERVGE